MSAAASSLRLATAAAEPRGDARHDAVHDIANQRRVGLPDVAVAQQRRELRQSLHEERDVSRDRGDGLDPPNQLPHRRSQLGQHRVLQIRARTPRSDESAASCRSFELAASSTCPVNRGLDEVHRILRLPAKSPPFLERALTADAAVGNAPVDAQQTQAVEKMTALAVGVVAEIELELLVECFGLEAQALCTRARS